MYNRLIAAAVMVLGIAAAQSPCPAVYVPIDGTCIHFVTVQYNWTEAEAHCEDLDGHLAVLDDCKLFGEVVKYINAQELEADFFWLGASDDMEEGSWFWITGENVMMGSPLWGQVSDDDQPDGGTEENCLASRQSNRHLFGDQYCGSEFESICQTNMTVDD